MRENLRTMRVKCERLERERAQLAMQVISGRARAEAERRKTRLVKLDPKAKDAALRPYRGT